MTEGRKPIDLETDEYKHDDITTDANPYKTHDRVINASEKGVLQTHWTKAAAINKAP